MMTLFDSTTVHIPLNDFPFRFTDFTVIVTSFADAVELVAVLVVELLEVVLEEVVVDVVLEVVVVVVAVCDPQLDPV